MKPFKFGFIIGRFNHIHAGHERMINYGTEVCEDLLVLVGSSQEQGTLRNPFDAMFRIDAIRKIYGDRIKVGYIPDLTHEDDITHEWGKHVLDTVTHWARVYGIESRPDVTIYGNDENRVGWYHPDDVQYLAQLVVPRANLNVSATLLRKLLCENKQAEWAKYVNPAIHHMYGEFRYDLKQIAEYKEGFIDG